MKINIVGKRQSALPDPPFTILLDSTDDWQSLFDKYPELNHAYKWSGGIFGSEFNPMGCYRFFHADGLIQWSRSHYRGYQHYPLVRWPA